MKLPTKHLITVGAGVVVFGAVSAFAATLAVGSTSLGSGNATVVTCNASAAVSYTSSYSVSGPRGYRLSTTPVTAAAGCAGMAFKVTVTDAANTALAEQTGTLDGTGSATPGFSSANVASSLVTGVSVVITG